VDQALYKKNISKDALFKDEYFKQTVIEECAKRFGCDKKEMVLIGHDVWTEAYYTMLFSGIDVALIKSAYSHLNQKIETELKCVTFIQRNWKDIKKLIEGKIIPNHELDCLKKYAQRKLSEELFKGTQLQGLAQLSNHSKP
jgi:hypothetical protein